MHQYLTLLQIENHYIVYIASLDWKYQIVF
jgi:hypothetical protein